MSDTPRSLEHDELRMRAYLLGKLPPSESADVETQVFANDADFDRLLDAQYDLIDAYARGTLSSADREAVERRLLSHPDGQRRAALARALSARTEAVAREARAAAPARDASAGRRDAGSRSFPLAMAAALVLGVGSLGWLGFENARLRRELLALRASTPVTPASAPPVTTLADASMPGVAEIALNARVPRSDIAIRTVEIAATARLARVRLEINETAPALVVAVERAGTGRIWTQSHDGSRQEGAIVVWLPAEILSSGDYEILIWRDKESASSLIGAYPFTVARR